MNKIIIGVFALLLIAGQSSVLFAGIEWQARTTSKSGDRESVSVVRGYAQKGFVREDFIESKGDGSGFKKGDYLIYDTAKGIVYWINAQDKTYSEMSMESLSRLAGAAGQVVQMKVTNPKVSVKKLEAGNVLGYACQHVAVSTSYDVETSVLFMTTKSRVEQVSEIWGSDAISKQDVSAAFEGKYFKTSFPEIDSLLQKEMEAYKNIGFILKSVLTQKTTDQDKKTQTVTNEMIVEKATVKELAADLFKVPAGYKKTESEIPGDTKDKGKNEGDSDSDVNAGDFFKGLFN